MFRLRHIEEVNPCYQEDGGIAPPAEQQLDLPVEPQLPEEPKARVKMPMSRKKKIILIVSACAVVLIAAAVVLTMVLIEAANSDKYEGAVSFMESNNLLEAKEEFLSLGEYKDSAVKAQDCQNKYDYDSAEALLQSGDYAASRDIFVALGDYGASPEKIQECDYAIATVLFEGGEPDKAKAAFLELGGYSDSAVQAEECQKELDYIAAVKLFDEEDYEAAQKAFVPLRGYKETNAKAWTCEKKINYAKADQLFADGKFYSAYTSFKALGTFEDASERMAECIQDNPIPGEIYRNPDYTKKTSGLEIKTSNDEYLRCFRIYKDDILVSTIFISGGKKMSIKLPAGTYTIKYAVGEKWFGPDELFGDEGYYYTILDNKDKSTFKFQSRGGWRFDWREVIRISSTDAIVLDRENF